MAYSEKVIDHYNNPRNVGSLDKKDPNVGTGLVGAPECGDVMKLQMKVNPDTRVIDGYRARAGSAAGEDSLFGARRGRDQGRALRLEDEAGRDREPGRSEVGALSAGWFENSARMLVLRQALRTAGFRPAMEAMP